MSPFFSIVIPTRQRHETLQFAIKTVLQQDFSDYEIVIADNCSSHDTYDVIQGFNDQKIKYFRSETPLAMSDNWEFAISKVTGQYIIVFGDDDGLINHSLLYLYKLIKETGFELIRWERVYYSWPNIQPHEYANYLNIPLDSNTNLLFKGKEIIQAVIDLKLDYTMLPMLYNSVVKMDLLLKLKRENGRVFNSIIPDVYSGFALAYMSDNYLSLGTPLTINGGSEKSNGTACMNNSDQHVIVSEYKQLNSQSNLSFHNLLPDVKSMTVWVVEPFFQLLDIFKIDDIKIDRRNIFSAIIKDVRVFTIEEKFQVVKVIEEFLKKDSILRSLLSSKQWNDLILTDIKPLSLSYRKGLNHKSYTLNAADFCLFNVLDVSKFVSGFYDFHFEDFDYVSYQFSSYAIDSSVKEESIAYGKLWKLRKFWIKIKSLLMPNHD